MAIYTSNHRDPRSGYFTQLKTLTDSYKFTFSLYYQAMELFPPTVINSPNQFCYNINIPVPYNHIDFCTVTIQYKCERHCSIDNNVTMIKYTLKLPLLIHEFNNSFSIVYLFIMQKQCYI